MTSIRNSRTDVRGREAEGPSQRGSSPSNHLSPIILTSPNPIHIHLIRPCQLREFGRDHGLSSSIPQGDLNRWGISVKPCHPILVDECCGGILEELHGDKMDICGRSSDSDGRVEVVKLMRVRKKIFLHCQV